jgi:glycosyltransferase involved in cell wall biosynthesis
MSEGAPILVTDAVCQQTLTVGNFLPAELRVAILLPCYNEAGAIEKTIADFRSVLPQSAIYVFDNNSTDNSRELATRSGAIVRTVTRQGKGHVVRRMFADVEADIYVIADGDATYDATAAPAMISRMLADHLDMVVGTRKSTARAAYRAGHRLGNKILTGLLQQLFGRSFTDILSGYRVLSHRFVKSFPALSAGFEIETEISVHALELAMPAAEVSTTYVARPEGSFSKLSTYQDGWRILRTIVSLYRFEKPIAFFGLFGALLLVIATILSAPLILTYMETGLVPRLPTAVLIVGLVIIAALSFTTGLILDTVVRGRQEIKRLRYLSLPWLSTRATSNQSNQPLEKDSR